MAKMTSLTLPPLAEAFMNEVTRKHNPKARVLKKSDSWLMRAIALIAKPFNPTFLENYVTTIGTTIYVPSTFLEEYNEMEVLTVITHETQHIIDYTANPLFFAAAWLFPLWLALLSLLAIGAIWNPWMLFWLLALGFLAPIPAPGRYWAELHGYRTAILFGRKVSNYNPVQMEQVYKWIEGQMDGGGYYFAWPFPAMVEKNLKDERFMSQPRYQEITDFLIRHGLINP